MKIRQVVIGLIGLIALVISFEVGRYFRPAPLALHDFTIGVQTDSTTGKCIATSPILNMHYTTDDRVQWMDNDTRNHKYWVDFTNVNPPPGSVYPPIPTSPPYTPESPLEHNDDHLLFSPSNPTGFFKVKQKDKYYYYAIFDQGNPSQPCKVSTDDKDTGLSIKP